jgi:hypothetical protein
MKKITLTEIKLWRPDILAPALMLGVALIVTYFFEKKISVYRPILSIEVFFASMLISARTITNALIKSLFITLLFLSLSFQLLELVSIGFNISIRDLYFLISSAPGGMPISAKYAASLFITLYMMALLFEKYIPIVSIRKRHLSIIIITPIVFDILFSANRLFPKDVVRFPNLVGAPIINNYINRGGTSEFQLWDTLPRSYSQLLKLTEKYNYVLFVEFESLGYFKSNLDAEVIDAGIKKSLPNYQLIDKYEEEFFGGTLSGELRSLCGIKKYGDIMINPGARRKELLNCIPNLVKNNDQSAVTLAAHANFGSFYNRYKVYPALGFDDSIFLNTLNEDSISDCGSVQFIGCDLSALNKVQEIVDDTIANKLFVHFMTINSHFPYSGKIISEINSNDSLTLYFAVVKSTLKSLENYTSNSIRSPDVIMISGDHAPFFTSLEDRNKFSKNTVPVYLFRKAGVQNSP